MPSRDALIDKPDLLRRIAKVRRWSRNGDVITICDRWITSFLGSIQQELPLLIRTVLPLTTAPPPNTSSEHVKASRDAGNPLSCQVTMDRLRDRMDNALNASN
jgi:hypothetical protein